MVGPADGSGGGSGLVGSGWFSCGSSLRSGSDSTSSGSGQTRLTRSKPESTRVNSRSSMVSMGQTVWILDRLRSRFVVRVDSVKPSRLGQTWSTQ
ncbi:hypothetical protein HanPI659440_Chr13g0502331 [Helianthus annuus]|nr:hypothetical protein HanPI659440_Chr13g0502331 [Helianthus annuus]